MIYADALQLNDGSWVAYVVDMTTQEQLHVGTTAHSNPQNAIDEAKVWADANT